VKTTLLITRDGMGQAEPALSRKLVQSYLGLLDLEDRVPAAVCLYADGVKLACQGSPVLEELKALEAKGAELLVCGTCLNFFGLVKRLGAGRESNMKEIQTAQWDAERVITI